MNTGKKKIVIRGSKVHDTGYRVFLLNCALKAGLSGFSASNQISPENTQLINVCIEGDNDSIKDFEKEIRENRPVKALVDEISTHPYNKRVIKIQDFIQLLQIEIMNRALHF
jgi:acylphosphatase